MRNDELTDSGVIDVFGFLALDGVTMNLFAADVLQGVGNGLHGAAGIIGAVTVAGKHHFFGAYVVIPLHKNCRSQYFAEEIITVL